MKAIIMAGGEGTRLRPMSLDLPKPMVSLFDRPVLEHILNLLKKNDICEACLTLKYLPSAVTDYFGIGDGFDMTLESRIERVALGTAGGVKNCADFIGGEDFLVISGDCVCDFDLKALIDFHYAKNADVTVALYESAVPLEYGLAVTNADGRIERFVEKPAWEGVLTNLINTGIYVISNKILDCIDEGGPSDFAKDLFPKLLKDGGRLYGTACEGYWCDIGSCGSYLRCCADVLDGKAELTLPVPFIKDGVRSGSGGLDGVQITPPVYIGENVTIEKGAEIGPHSVIGAFSTVLENARVNRSVICGATVMENAVIDGAVMCVGVTVGAGSEIREGAVIGRGTEIGPGSIVGHAVKIWPGKIIPESSFVRSDVINGSAQSGLSFSTPGIITGDIRSALSPEACLALGSAAAEVKKVGVGWCGGEAARMAAEAFCCGVNSRGGAVYKYECGFLACASFISTALSLSLNIFIEQRGERIKATFLGVNGNPVPHGIERMLLRRDIPGVCAGAVGGCEIAGDALPLYLAAARAYAGRCDSKRPLTVFIKGGGAENRALRKALSDLGCHPAATPNGVPVFEVAQGGAGLSACDEDGRFLNSERLFVLACMTEISRGAKRLAVPYGAPELIDSLAQALGVSVLKVSGDDDAPEELLKKLRCMRDGVFVACLICGSLMESGKTLSLMAKDIPRFSRAFREVEIAGDKAAVMHELSASNLAADYDPASGVRFFSESGNVLAAPMRTKNAILLRGEGATEEIAEELCFNFEKLAKNADSELLAKKKKR